MAPQLTQGGVACLVVGGHDHTEPLDALGDNGFPAVGDVDIRSAQEGDGPAVGIG